MNVPQPRISVCHFIALTLLSGVALSVAVEMIRVDSILQITVDRMAVRERTAFRDVFRAKLADSLNSATDRTYLAPYREFGNPKIQDAYESYCVDEEVRSLGSGPDHD
jgi:hypothetical protein